MDDKMKEHFYFYFANKSSSKMSHKNIANMEKVINYSKIGRINGLQKTIYIFRMSSLFYFWQIIVN